MTKVAHKKITLDDLAAMCMREFNSIRNSLDSTKETVERIEIRLDKVETRLDNVAEIVLEDHRARIINLEKEVFLR